MTKLPKLKKEDKGVIYITNIPTILKADFKSYCAKNETSMKKEIIRFMKSCVKRMRQERDEVEHDYS